MGENRRGSRYPDSSQRQGIFRERGYYYSAAIAIMTKKTIARKKASVLQRKRCHWPRRIIAETEYRKSIIVPGNTVIPKTIMAICRKCLKLLCPPPDIGK